jgi:hypothetical protein
VKRTDDFLADLETQLGAAAAGRLRRRRRPRVAAVLRPALVAVVAAAAVGAFVLADGIGTDPERAADPPPPALPGGALLLPPAVPLDDCAEVVRSDDQSPPQELIDELEILRRPQGAQDTMPAMTLTVPVTELSLSHVRRWKREVPVTLVPSAGVVPRACTEPDARPSASEGPGVCVIVELDRPRTACWTLAQIRAGKAVAALDAPQADDTDFVVALMPDGVREVTFQTPQERDSYTVEETVVVAGLKGARSGDRITVTTSTETGACSDLIVERGTVPEDVMRAVPAFTRGTPQEPPADVVEFLRRSGAGHAWLNDARWILPPRDEGVGAWVVPVRDTRSGDCRHPLLQRPENVGGAGACLVAVREDEALGAMCLGADDLPGGAIMPIGSRIVFGFPPKGVMHARTTIDGVPATYQVTDGVLIVEIPEGGKAEPFEWHSASEPRIAVLNGTSISGLGASVANRIGAATGVEPARIGDYLEQTRSETLVLAASGHRSTAEAIRRELRVNTVGAIDGGVRSLAPDADVVVIVGADLAP